VLVIQPRGPGDVNDIEFDGKRQDIPIICLERAVKSRAGYKSRKLWLKTPFCYF